MKRSIRIALQLLSLVLFGLILWWAGAEPWQQILDSDWRLVLVALLIYGVVGIISALRLRVVAQALTSDEVGSRRRFYYLSMTARVLGLVLPRGISTLGGKSVGLRALGISLRRSLWIVLMDNIYDILTLGLAAIPAIFFLQDQIGVVSLVVLTLALWALLALALWLTVSRGKVAAIFEWLLARVPWLSQRLELDDRIAAHLFPRAGPALSALLHTAVLNVLLIATYAAISRALELSAPFWLFAAAFPITQLSLVIAVAPGGLGIFDLGWLGLLRLGGMPQEEALTFVVAQRAFIYVFVLLWAACSALLSFTEEREIQTTTPTEPPPGSPLPPEPPPANHPEMVERSAE